MPKKVSSTQAEAEKAKTLILASCDQKVGSGKLFKYLDAIFTIRLNKDTQVKTRKEDQASKVMYPVVRSIEADSEEQVQYWIFEQLVHREHRQSGSGHGRPTDTMPLVVTALAVQGINDIVLKEPEEDLVPPDPDLPTI